MPEQRLSLVLRTALGCRIDARSQRYWNLRLTNKFAMAPTALVEGGEITDAIYAEECAKFDQSTADYKIIEVAEIADDYPGGVIWEVGWGQGNGAGHIPYVYDRGLSVQIADQSKVALGDALRYLKALRNQPQESSPEECIHLVDIVYALENLMVNSRDSMLDVSRVIHHLNRRRQAAFWQACGHFLTGRGHFLTPPPHRRIVITNPNTRDNQKWVPDKGSGEKKWKSVRPFNIDEKLDEIAKAAKQPVRITRQSEPFEVFDEWFTIATIMLAPKKD